MRLIIQCSLRFVKSNLTNESARWTRILRDARPSTLPQWNEVLDPPSRVLEAVVGNGAVNAALAPLDALEHRRECLRASGFACRVQHGHREQTRLRISARAMQDNVLSFPAHVTAPASRTRARSSPTSSSALLLIPVPSKGDSD